jgi:hypothetical protein
MARSVLGVLVRSHDPPQRVRYIVGKSTNVLTFLVAVALQARGDLVAVGLVADQDFAR